MSVPSKFVSRTTWAARKPKTKPSGDITPEKGGTALHYEGVDVPLKAHTECYKRVQQIQNFHMDTRGWNDIAYTALVCSHGYVFEGRGPGVRTAANGTDAGNQNYYAICWIGGPKETFPEGARVAIKQAISWLRVEGGAGKAVRPHSYFKSTSCPGDQIRHWLGAGMPLKSVPKPPAAPPKFPLPAGYYFGPKAGPKESVSGYYSHSADLKVWQAQMKKRGAAIDVTGHYDAKTYHVAGELQKEKHLLVDHRIGPLTWAAAWK